MSRIWIQIEHPELLEAYDRDMEVCRNFASLTLDKRNVILALIERLKNG